MSKIELAIHGGAGTLVHGMMTPEKEKAYKKALQLALDSGYKILENGGS
jgi:beta-aspartyl-peptidase (threonine type)